LIVRSLAKFCCCFYRSTRGVAAIEFAAILPVMAVIFLATFDGGRAIAAYMKVRAATYALASITNQYPTIASSDMTAILGATSVVMAPYNSSTPVVTVSQIQITSSSNANVEWSASQGGTPRTVVPSPLPSALTTSGTYPTYLIFAEVSYAYTPLFGFFGSGGITFSDNLYVTPRGVSCIVYTPHSSTC
jgi:Flp pilus assembly protein TadG